MFFIRGFIIKGGDYMCMHASMHPCIHASMPPCVHTYTHTYTHTVIRTQTRACTGALQELSIAGIQNRVGPSEPPDARTRHPFVPPEGGSEKGGTRGVVDHRGVGSHRVASFPDFV